MQFRQAGYDRAHRSQLRDKYAKDVDQSRFHSLFDDEQAEHDHQFHAHC